MTWAFNFKMFVGTFTYVIQLMTKAVQMLPSSFDLLCHRFVISWKLKWYIRAYRVRKGKTRGSAMCYSKKSLSFY